MAYTTEQIRDLLTREAQRQGVDPQLVLGVARQESGFNPEAVSRAGALGVMQLMPATARQLGVNPHDVEQNIRGGITYLRQQQRRFGDTRLALAAYNAGPGAVEKYGGVPPYRETQDYVQRILGGSDRGEPARRPGFLTRMSRALSPASAEAAPATGRETGASGRDVGSVLFGRSPAGPPSARRTPAPGPASRAGAGRDLGQDLFGTAPAPSAPEAGTAPALQVAPGPSPGQAPVESMQGPLLPPPRSPALAQEQQQAAQQPWWQRAARAAGAASPEIALMAPETPALEQARAEMSPEERTELRRLEGQAGTGANLGEIAGQAIGSAVLPGAGTAIGGTLGAVAGKTAETLLQEGRLPSWKEMGTEAAWSALPEAAESLGRLGLRTIARGTRGGQLIRFDEAARRARALPEVFEAQTREQVGQAFEAVRHSGVQLDTTALRQEIQALRPGKYADVMAEVRRLDRDMKTGARYQQLVQNLRQTGGVQVTGMPIGDLQQLRSGLRSRIDQLEHTEARQLLRDVQRAVDTAVDQGIARGRTAAGQTPEQLQQARRDWARLRASEDMGDLIERTITTTPDLSMASFNMRQFADAMRRNTGDLAQSANRSLDQVPGARARFQREMDDIARLYQTAELPMADVFGIWRMPGFAMARQWISQALMSDAGRQVFRQAMIDGRGRLSLNGFAAAVNAGRRELGLEPLVLPEGTPPGRGPGQAEQPSSAPAPTAAPER